MFRALRKGKSPYTWVGACGAIALLPLFATIDASANEPAKSPPPPRPVVRVHPVRPIVPAARIDFRGRDVRSFTPTEAATWQGGSWSHESHNGRYGWWWQAGGVRYFYDAPVYPYPIVVSAVAAPLLAAALVPPLPPPTPILTYRWQYC